jgi:glycosyltransferase involved in cell wall biosynthesis/peptidoglycan/xylan/chitin deacetylase (PgdA/CDA1 family)
VSPSDQPAGPVSTPDLSVVIATYNRAAQLRTCLDALARQDDIVGFEVVVVVDGSTDGTRELLARYPAPYPLRVVYQENAGQCRSLNRGVSEATGRFCVLLDDDIVADRGLLAAHLRAQREGGGVLGAGRLTMEIPPAADWYVLHFCHSWIRHYGRLDAGQRPVAVSDCYSGNLSFPREAFVAVGGFGLDLPRGYDIELAFRLAQSGLRVVYLPAASAVNHDRKTSGQLLRDEEREGESAVEIHRRHPATLSETGLSTFAEDRRIEVACRRVLLALRFPLAPLRATGVVLGWLGRSRRWATFVRHYAFWRGVRRALRDDEAWRSLTRGVTILLYHAVGEPGEGSSRFVVSGPEFAWQMRWLARKGYRVLDLEEYVRLRREHRLVPGGAVVITFDDGYVDNATVAAPILAERRFLATLFLVTDRMGGCNDWDREGVLAGRRIMRWETARAIEADGIRLAPHGRSHATLQRLSRERFDAEIAGAWDQLARAVTRPVPVFAFPFGRYDPDAVAAVQRAGLQAACTVHRGRNWLSTPLDALRRVEVRGDRGRLAFRLAVWRGDERLRIPR